MEQSDLLKYTATQLRALDIHYAVVGSFASSIWGESRLTQDIDIVVDLRSGHVPQICAAFPDPEFYISATAVREAIVHGSQFNVLNPSSGTKLDFMIPGRTAWVLAQLNRSMQVQVFPDLAIDIAAPEDVILGKLVYYREGGSEKHLRDINGILDLSARIIDPEYVSRQAQHLGIDDLWEGILNSRSQN